MIQLLSLLLLQKQNRRVASRQTPYSLRRATPLPGFLDVKNPLRWGSGPVSKGLTFLFDLLWKSIKTRLQQEMQPSTTVEALKSLGTCGGNLDS